MLVFINYWTEKCTVKNWKKLNNCLKITDLINNMFRPQKTLKKSSNKIIQHTSSPSFIIGYWTWAVKARDARRITAAEMKYTRTTTGCTWTDNETNTEIANELNKTKILDEKQDYRINWIQHVNRMPRNRLLWIIKNCRPKGRRNQRRPLKRFLDAWDRNSMLAGWWRLWLWRYSGYFCQYSTSSVFFLGQYY